MAARRPPSLWRHHGLSIALFLFFVGSLIGQALTGWLDENDVRAAHGLVDLTVVEYVRSPSFLEATMENWESEFFQMFVFVVFTIFLFQRGSAESKDPDKKEPEPRVTAASPSAVRAGGWRRRLYENSLSLAFLALFLISFALHAVAGMENYNQEQLNHGKPIVTLAEYLVSSRFWFESLQNWQSEFLSIWAMVVLTIYLRQKGSPESKPVASPHGETGK